ncbi:MAG: hypothetical protein GX476_10175, partial [Firmicutes bacterium]|nr:hypothetical protein [Bacillota bacterium]
AQDLAVGRDGTIYIADTGNNRLVLLDASFSRVRVISEFDRDGVPDRLSAPSGIFVTGDGEVYIGRCRWVTTYLGSLQRAGRL